MPGIVPVEYPDHDSLAAAAAEGSIQVLAQALGEYDQAYLCVTGGRIGTSTLAAMLTAPGAADLDWSKVHVWFSDERYVSADDDQRNDKAARAALFDHAPANAAVVHAMPSSDQGYASVEDAAAAYGQEILAEGHGSVPAWDVLLLGIGEDAHVASLFPHLPGIDSDAVALAVHDSPKPPPTRISFGLSTINAARKIWVLASGEGKADAVKLALDPASTPDEAPASAVHGLEQTLLMLDVDAAKLVQS